MRAIHDLLNTLGEEQNITAQKTALNDVALSLLDLPRLSSYLLVRLIRSNVLASAEWLGETQNEADAAKIGASYTAK
jgi:hypothetical protein